MTKSSAGHFAAIWFDGDIVEDVCEPVAVEVGALQVVVTQIRAERDGFVKIRCTRPEQPVVQVVIFIKLTRLWKSERERVIACARCGDQIALMRSSSAPIRQ